MSDEGECFVLVVKVAVWITVLVTMFVFCSRIGRIANALEKIERNQSERTSP